MSAFCDDCAHACSARCAKQGQWVSGGPFVAAYRAAHGLLPDAPIDDLAFGEWIYPQETEWNGGLPYAPLHFSPGDDVRFVHWLFEKYGLPTLAAA